MTLTIYVIDLCFLLVIKFSAEYGYKDILQAKFGIQMSKILVFEQMKILALHT